MIVRNATVGSWSASHKFPQALETLVLISNDHAIGCTAGASLTPRYNDAASSAGQSTHAGTRVQIRVGK